MLLWTFYHLLPIEFCLLSFGYGQPLGSPYSVMVLGRSPFDSFNLTRYRNGMSTLFLKFFLLFLKPCIFNARRGYFFLILGFRREKQGGKYKNYCSSHTRGRAIKRWAAAGFLLGLVCYCVRVGKMLWMTFDGMIYARVFTRYIWTLAPAVGWHHLRWACGCVSVCLCAPVVAGVCVSSSETPPPEK